MKGLLALALAAALCGCTLSMGVALGPEKFRILEIEYSGEGAGTFCWEGVGMNDMGIRPIGWGPDECTRNWAPQD